MPDSPDSESDSRPHSLGRRSRHLPLGRMERPHGCRECCAPLVGPGISRWRTDSVRTAFSFDFGENGKDGNAPVQPDPSPHGIHGLGTAPRHLAWAGWKTGYGSAMLC